MADNIPKLFEKLINNECSKDEVEQLLNYLADGHETSVSSDLILAQLSRKVDPAVISEELRSRLDDSFRKIMAEADQEENNRVPVIRKLNPAIRYAGVAAMITAILFSALYIYFNRSRSAQKTAGTAAVKDIPPGRNKAVLTLADGRQILLTEAANGELARQAGIRITKTSDGKLVYTADRTETTSSVSDISYNTISTPRGGQYQINLPDGSQVWLNAASSLKFPAAFSPAGTRKVTLSGEAYFEVAKDKHRPFVVTTAKQSLEVLGTHFNVDSYPDEPGTKTTLLEGSVRISADDRIVLLKPGQQATVNEAVSVSEVDPEEAIAWQKGYFHFDDEELESVMKKVSRWYDVEAEYEDASLKHELFAAYSTRFANVSQLLKRLNEVGSVRFRLEGRKIIITKKK